MRKSIAILMLISILMSCSDKYLELKDPTAAGSLKSMADYELVCDGLYAQLNTMNLYGFQVLGIFALLADHTCDLSWTSDAVRNQMALHQLTPSQGNVYVIWQGYYTLIADANNLLMVLDASDRIPAANEEEEKRFEQMKGEAIFWRAWAHQQLVQFWGEGYPCNGDGSKKGVPIKDFVPKDFKSATNKERATVDEVYKFVTEEYQKASNLLPDEWTGTNTDKARPTKWACESFLGQALLYEGKYDESKTTLKTVIDQCGKTLLPYADYKNMFTDSQTKFSKESILELYFIDRACNGWGIWDGGRGSMYPSYIAYTYANDNGEPTFSAWSNHFFHDSNIARFGNDKRLHIAAMEPGTPVKVGGVDRVTVKYKDIDESNLGWSVGKYQPRKESVTDLLLTVGIDQYLMRLADVYLMYAEACYETKDESNAREYANKVRRRGNDYPADIPNPAIDIPLSVTGSALKDSIREERFKEFCAEGVQHWTDVCRWKTLEHEINTWYKKTRVGAPVYSPKALLLPIPENELLYNVLMEQSDVYK